MDEAEASDGFSDWEQIRYPTHPTPAPMAPSGEEDMVDMAVVTTQDNSSLQQQPDLSVFPPSRHEGLEITSDDELEVNSSVASRSSSTGNEVDSGPLKKVNEIGKILANGIVKVGARVRYFMAFGWGVWSVGAVSGVFTAVFLSLVYAKVRKWRARIKEENQERLIFLIQEKDQKINQLMVQLAHMNELLSARRRVPVLRVS